MLHFQYFIQKLKRGEDLPKNDPMIADAILRILCEDQYKKTLLEVKQIQRTTIMIFSVDINGSYYKLAFHYDLEPYSFDYVTKEGEFLPILELDRSKNPDSNQYNKENALYEALNDRCKEIIDNLW